MLHSICIRANAPSGATSFRNAPIQDVTDGKLWLLVDDDDCYWEPEIVEDFIDGEDQFGSFAKPIETLANCRGWWFGYEILNAEDCYSEREGFI